MLKDKIKNIFIGKYAFFKTLLFVFLVLFILLNIIFAILSISLSLQFDVYEGNIFDGVPGVLIASSFLAVILTFLLKWTKDYKLTGKLITSSEFFNKERARKILIGIGAIILLTAAGIVIKDEITWRLSAGENDCSLGGNIAIIKVYGGIVSYEIVVNLPEESFEEADVVSSEDVVGYLEDIENDEQIKGIIVLIDSGGGSPIGGEEIMVALKKISKPVVAVIREMGASAAYWIATGADRIYASKVSDVGGIGVTMSYLDYSQTNEYEGIIYQQISSGKFKDTGDPDKSLSAEEKELLIRDTEKLHQIFIEYVAENRGMDVEAVTKLADGSTMLGEAAKAAGLIDEIGDLSSAKDWLRDQIGIELSVCVYE